MHLNEALFTRNTATDVEKTGASRQYPVAAEKHLHGRGEDTTKERLLGLCQETPPRTWRRLLHRLLIETEAGNTSTDVEKTARFSVRLIQPTLLFVVVVVKGGSLTN